MRIRKNAKISPFLYPASSPNAGAVIQTHLCQLNQSPWDVMSFSPPASPLPLSPPPSQVNKNGVSAGNGCSPDNVPVIERKFSADWECKSINSDTTNKTVEREQPRVVKDEPIIFCSKSDGKSGQCRKKVTKGKSFCEHHLSIAKNYNNLNQSKKPEKSVMEVQRPTRPKKAPASSSSSNPYQFYYYSGFGPNWRKRRGESSKNNIGSDVSQNVEQENELNPLLLCQFDDDSNSRDAEEEYENEEKGKKRVRRKTIKAKSLNSLM